MMNEEILSQDKINKLLEEEKTKNDLTEQEKDVIGEVGNISMGSAATALHNIVEQEVKITTPEVSIITLEGLSKAQERPCVIVEVEYLTGLEGVNLLVVKEQDAAIIADLMLGGDGSDIEVEMGEIQLSAIGEAMNQMIGSASTSMSSIFNTGISISPPRVEYLTLEDKMMESRAFAEDDIVVQISFRISIGDLIDSTIMQLAPLEFLKDMVQKLVEGQLSLYEAADGEESESEEKETEKPRPEGGEAREEPKQEEGEEKRDESTAEEKDKVDVGQVAFTDFAEEEGEKGQAKIDFLGDIPLHVTVRLGKAHMTIQEVLELGKGSIIELDRLAGEDVDLLVNGKLVAKGEIVVIEENFAFRVKKIINPMERIKDL